jgi:hypothetical protein
MTFCQLCWICRRKNIWHLAVSFRIKDREDICKKVVTNILVENVRTTIQCCDKWDKMKKKYFQEKTTKGVTCSATTSCVWFNRMKQILEGATKADGTPNGLDQGYAHARLLKH